MAARTRTGNRIIQFVLLIGTLIPNCHNRPRDIKTRLNVVNNIKATKKEISVFETSPAAAVSLSQELDERYKLLIAAAPIIVHTATMAYKRWIA